jgi:hypothetical protein
MSNFRLIFCLSRCAVVGLLLSANSCGPNYSDSVTKEQIREAVFRYQFSRAELPSQHRAASYCLEVEDEQDPSEALIRRFAAHTPPVKKRSECEIVQTANDPGFVKDRATSQRAILLRIYSVTLKVWKEAEVKAGYYQDGLAGSTHLYFLQNQNGKWVVVREEMLSVS